MIDKQASTSKAFCQAPVFFARFAIGRLKVLMSYNVGGRCSDEIRSSADIPYLVCIQPYLEEVVEKRPECGEGRHTREQHNVPELDV